MTIHAPTETDTLTINEGGGVTGYGSVAMKLLQSGFKASALRNNSVLRNREWIDVDTTVVNVARQRLVAVGDLMSHGLRYDVANALGITRVEWETVSDFGTADVSMSGLTKTNNNRITYGLNALPLPIIHKDFQINIRALAAGRNLGQSIDTTQVSLATKIVTEKAENMLFNGGFSAGASNGTIYGYTNFPGRQTFTPSDWSNVATTGATMLSDLQTAIEKAYAANMYGPYMVYVSNSAFINMGSDFKANGDKTILERLKAVPNIIDIKPVFSLAPKQFVVVQFTQDVVDEIVGMQPTAVMWEGEGGMVANFKVMAIMVPRMKEDQANQCGIIHGTAA